MFETLTTSEAAELHSRLLNAYKRLCIQGDALAEQLADYRPWDDTASETFNLAIDLLGAGATRLGV